MSQRPTRTGVADTGAVITGVRAQVFLLLQLMKGASSMFMKMYGRVPPF